MKKLIAALTLMLAFTINANAQDKKATAGTNDTKKDVKEVVAATPQVNSQVLAKKDAADLKSYLNLTDTETDSFFRLFEMKYNTLAETKLSDERKVALSHVMEAKIRATLNAEQTEKLERNKDLLNRLINTK